MSHLVAATPTPPPPPHASTPSTPLAPASHHLLPPFSPATPPSSHAHRAAPTPTPLHLLCLAAERSPPPSTPPLDVPYSYPIYLPSSAYAYPYMYPPLNALPYMYAPPPPSISMQPAAAADMYAVPHKVKGPWRPEEDAILTQLVHKMGARRWTLIASHIPGRTGKQARERWLNQLSPTLAKRPWTSEEDRVVMEAHARLGNRWSEIAKLLNGRTDNATKNRFNTTIRRQISQMRGAPAKIAVPTSPVASDVEDARRCKGKKGVIGKRKRDGDDARVVKQSRLVPPRD